MLSPLQVNPPTSIHNEHLAMYEQVVKERGFELCVGVLDSSGKFHVMGNKDMMVTQLNNITTSTRRSSLNWIPPEPLPKLPMPLQELLLNENKNLVKKTLQPISIISLQKC